MKASLRIFAPLAHVFWVTTLVGATATYLRMGDWPEERRGAILLCTAALGALGGLNLASLAGVAWAWISGRSQLAWVFGPFKLFTLGMIVAFLVKIGGDRTLWGTPAATLPWPLLGLAPTLLSPLLGGVWAALRASQEPDQDPN